jgi:hypothetical protein
MLKLQSKKKKKGKTMKKTVGKKKFEPQTPGWTLKSIKSMTIASASIFFSDELFHHKLSYHHKK